MSGAQPAPATDERVTVLLAEDEALLRMITSDTLRDGGYEVIEAADGAEALAILERRGSEIDLLLTDIKMPKLDGYQLTCAALQLLPDLKVMLMTGYAHEPAPQNIRDADIRVLLKPFDFDRLLVEVRSVLGG